MSQYDLSRPVLDRVREAADVVAVIGDVVTLKKAGRNWQGLCPFHSERTPSFSVSRDKGTYYCFGCKRGGDAIDFVMEVERLSFAEAVERLADRFGVELPLASPDARRRRDEGEVLREALEAAQAFFVAQVGEDRPRFFLERRGVSLEAAAAFGLGYAPASWRALYDGLRARIPERALLDAGLIAEGDRGTPYDRFRDRVTIPIRSGRGQLIAFGGRALGDDPPKYLNSPETALFSKSRTLFALERALPAFARAERAVLVEGYFDCLALQLAGFTETIATLGTALTEHHARELTRRVQRVIVCFDGDAAGRAAALTAVRTLLAAGLEPAVTLLPEGQDPDDCVRREGASAFAARLTDALPAAAFLVAQLGEGRGERRARLRGVLEVADACPDPVRRFVLREALAHAADVPLAELEATAAAPAAAPPPGESDLNDSPGEWALLRALLIDLPAPQRRELAASLPLAALGNPIARSIFAVAIELIGRGEDVDTFRLVRDLDDARARRALAALEHEVPACNPARLMENVRELAARQREQRHVALQAEIERAAAAGDRERCAELLAERAALLRQRGSRER